jgi:Protein tyrosine and serine/threonine kinase
MLPGNQLSPQIGGYVMQTTEVRSVFRSPESYSGAKVDSAADVYALGVLMWEVVAGKPPQTHPAAAGKKKAASPPPSLQECDPMWHPLLSACWQTDPTSRPTAHQAFQMLPDECDLELEQLSFLHSDSASDEFMLTDDSSDLTSDNADEEDELEDELGEEEEEEEEEEEKEEEEDCYEHREEDTPGGDGTRATVMATDSESDGDSDSTDDEMDEGGNAFDSFGTPTPTTRGGTAAAAESRHSLVYRDLEPQPLAMLQDLDLRVRACKPDVEVRAGFDQDPNAPCVRVHSVVLRARCRALRNQLDSGLRVFSAPCSSGQALRAVLRTVYKGSVVQLPEKHVKDASNVARWLGLSRLACTLDRTARQSTISLPLCTVATGADSQSIRTARTRLVELYHELSALKREAAE